MKNNDFKKEYLAILEGNLNKRFGIISAPIARKNDSIIERCVDFENGDFAITHYELIKNLTNYCVVKFRLETGRTHQIRVHSSYIGHSIVGDTLYGNKSELISRQALHAYRITFIHPISHKEVIIESEIPKDMRVFF